jgi:type VI secretion system protein ImpH
MANKSRPTSDAVTHAATLEQALQETPYKFGFYQTLRRIECAHPDKPRLGVSLRPVDDAVRLTQEPSLAFAPSTLASFRPRRGNDASRLGVYFFGMFGPNGPLPLHLSEYARDRLRNSDDPTFSEFLDIFHHRMLSLFYRAWANAQPAVNFDRPDQDRFSVYTGAFLVWACRPYETEMKFRT